VLSLCAAAVLQVRTKVFKCLGLVVEADSRVMNLPEVAAAVHAAQEDDSPAVKEAVLDLLAKLLATNPELAGEYFDTLVQASYVSAVPALRGGLLELGSLAWGGAVHVFWHAQYGRRRACVCMLLAQRNTGQVGTPLR
jgi:hypothetical protein